MDVKQTQEPQPKTFTKNEILDVKESGQHRILTVTASNYDGIVSLCKGKRILKAKRLPYNTHSTTCAWINTAHREVRSPCSCYYFGSNEDFSLPKINQWEVTTMA